MEGSRHERAALVTTAYLIGGLTAFIAFGIQTTVNLFPANLSATVIDSMPPSMISDYATTQGANSSVRYVDGMLEVETADGVQVLSFNPVQTGMNPGDGFEEQGVHYGDLLWRASESGQFIFFCEKAATDATECKPFIYDALRQTIHFVTFAGDRALINSNLAESARFVGDELLVGSLRSASAVNPWVLSYR